MQSKPLGVKRAKSWARKLIGDQLSVEFELPNPMCRNWPEIIYAPQWRLTLTGDAKSLDHEVNLGFAALVLEVNQQLRKAAAKVTADDLIAADRDFDAQWVREDWWEEPSNILAVGVAVFRKLPKRYQSEAKRLTEVLIVTVSEESARIYYQTRLFPFEVPEVSGKSHGTGAR